MLSTLASIYKVDIQENAIDLLLKDFNSFKKYAASLYDPHAEIERLSTMINTKIQRDFKHKSDEKCLCVKRAYRDRTTDKMKEIYFGFDEENEIITQQRLDSIHCQLVHVYDRAEAKDNNDANITTSSLKNIMMQSRNHNKFNTKNVYQTGIRYYYWKYYRWNAEPFVKFQDITTDPGNKKGDGKHYQLKDWYVSAAAKDLKEEILAFGQHFGVHISKGQFKVALKKMEKQLNTKECRKLKCSERDLEERYGLKFNCLISLNHLLAVYFYCSFTDASTEFSETFRRRYSSESDESVKKRHSKCAIWAKYLRECVEGFGLRLQKGSTLVPAVFYHGVTKEFLFKNTILRFNGPLSTSVSDHIAESFASGQGGTKSQSQSGYTDGMVLTLKPHWGDYRGNIRALNCQSYSDFPHEDEYLFMGGLEPLVIHNIREIKLNGSEYLKKIQAINNIHQIFEGMACKFVMKPTLIRELIDNRLRYKDKKNKDYITNLFDFYCDEIREIVISLSLMDQSYKMIRDNFIDKHKSNALKLQKIIKLFPNCRRISISDGHNYQLIPMNIDTQYTILGVTKNALSHVNDTKHSLECIHLEMNDEIESQLLNEFNEDLLSIGWVCEYTKTQNDYDSDNDGSILYKIKQKK